MIDKDFCLSSYIAFRYIWRDDMDFMPGMHHRLFESVPAKERIGVKTSADIDREISDSSTTCIANTTVSAFCSQVAWTAPAWLPT